MRSYKTPLTTAMVVAVAGYACQAMAVDIVNLSLEELLTTEIDKVQGASRLEQIITEAPASVTILTRKDIRRHGWRTLSELLRSAPGINTSYNTLYSTASIRGQTSALDLGSFLLLMIDGERLSSNVSDAALLGEDMPIDMDWLDRVEIVTGASSAVYGANAALAVVNLITRSEDSLANIEATVSVGSDANRTWRLAGKKSFEGGHIAVSASHSASDGYLPNDDNSTSRWFARIAKGDFTFTALNLDREKAYPYQQPPVIVEGHLNTQYGSATLSWRKELTPALQANVSLQYGESEFTVGYGNPALVYRNYPTTGSWRSLDASLTQKIADHTLVYGFDYMNSPDTRRYGYEATPTLIRDEFDHDVSFTRHALFIQDIWKVRPDLGLHFALRHETDERFDDSLLVPRLGMVYQYAPNTTIKLTYGESFRAHPAFEVSSLSSTARALIPGKPPEQIKQLEVRLEHNLSPATRLETSLYHIQTAEQLRYVPSIKGKFRIDEGSSLSGLEAGLLWRSQDSSRLRASLTVQDGEYDSDGARLYNSPEHMVKLDYSRPLDALDAFIGLEALYTGKRQTVIGSTVPSYALTNLTLSSAPRNDGHWGWQLGLYNLFDRQYYDPSPYSLKLGAIEQEGRSWRVQFKLRF